MKPLKNFWLNIGMAAVAAVVILFISLQSLGWYTNHNERIPVPSVVGQSFEEAVIELEKMGLNAKVVDSVYNEKAEPFSIVEQNPTGNEEVKSGRTIYLVINTGNRPKVKMPKLVDMSLTLATAVLKNRNLKLGKISYEFDEIGNNLIVNQLHKGNVIQAGTQLPTGSVIDLVVASNDKSKFSESDSLMINESDELPDDMGN